MKKTLFYTTLFIGLGLILGLLAVQPSLAQESEMQVANSLYENGYIPVTAGSGLATFSLQLNLLTGYM